MPPLPTGSVNITSRQFSQIYTGQWGDGPLQSVYTAPSNTLLVLIYMQQVVPQNPNSPAYIVNVGSGAHYTGGSIHNLPNQIPIQPPNGQEQSSVNVGLIMQPGESLTVQLANPGTFFLEFTIYEFTASR